jgi:hypothetical protein
LSWAYWEFSAGFGIYDPVSGTYKTELVNALLKNSMPTAKVLPSKPLFDLNGTAGWNLNLNSGALATMNAEGIGLKVAISSVTGTGWHVQLARSGFPLSYKRRYLVKFKAKADKAISFTGYMGRASNPYNAYSNYNSFTVGTSESEYTFLFTMNEPFDANARISFDLGNSTGVLQITALRVEEIVDEIPLEARFEQNVPLVYPNPFDQYVQVSGVGPQEVRFVDLTGRIHQSSMMETGGTLETKGLMPGPYILQVITGKSNKFETVSVYKQ